MAVRGYAFSSNGGTPSKGSGGGCDDLGGNRSDWAAAPAAPSVPGHHGECSDVGDAEGESFSEKGDRGGSLPDHAAGEPKSCACTLNVGDAGEEGLLASGNGNLCSPALAVSSLPPCEPGGVPKACCDGEGNRRLPPLPPKFGDSLRGLPNLGGSGAAAAIESTGEALAIAATWPLVKPLLAKLPLLLVGLLQARSPNAALVRKLAWSWEWWVAPPPPRGDIAATERCAAAVRGGGGGHCEGEVRTTPV